MRLFATFVFLTILFIISCKSSQPMTAYDHLTKEKWVLSALGGNSSSSEDFKDNLPYVQFGDGGGFTGFTGCNNFNGNYSLTDTGITLDVGAMTRKMCPGNGEQQFLSQLAKVSAFNVDGDLLKLKDGTELLMEFYPE